MRYFGGKQRISKPLSEFINSNLKENQIFIDLFCGSCNIISKIDPHRKLIANDKHKYLIAMWKALQDGWTPPEELTHEEYQFVRENKDEKPYLTGFIGFGCSFAGKWFGGFAKSKDRNYCSNAKNSTLKKLDKLHNVEFYNSDYSQLKLPDNRSLIYCDIPYKNSTTYSLNEVGKFNHDEFYEWVRTNSESHDIYISEYKENVPDDFTIVWEYESKKDIRNKDNIQEKTIEVLIKYK